MAGYSKLFVIGELAGFAGGDGVNPIDLLILLGNADRQWLEPRYFNDSIKPLGDIAVVIPERPDDPDGLLDACIAFTPNRFASCEAIELVRSQIVDMELDRLDFHLAPHLPWSWADLREQARPLFRRMSIWRADLVLMPRITP